MVKKSMDDLLKRRMSAAQQASELEVGNEAYETMFQAKADAAAPRFCELPIKSLCPFRTADIGFRPYPPEKLRAFSQQLAEQGIYERIIVRPIPNTICPYSRFMASIETTHCLYRKRKRRCPL